MVEIVLAPAGTIYFCPVKTLSILRKVLFFSLLWASLPAQIVNIEQLRFQRDSSRWLFQDDLSFNIFRNTQQVVDFENNFLLRYQRAGHRLLLLNSLHFNFTENTDFAQSGFLHFRYVKQLSERWDWEVFSQLQGDRPLQIERRILYGLGPRLSIDQKGNFQFFTGHLFMYEDDLERETGIQHFDWRLSSYVSMFYQYKDRVQWSSVTYYQPRLDDWSDWRLSFQNQLAFKLGAHWAFTVSAQLNYDAEPVQAADIPNLTYKIDNGVRIRF